MKMDGQCSHFFLSGYPVSPAPGSQWKAKRLKRSRVDLSGIIVYLALPFCKKNFLLFHVFQHYFLHVAFSARPVI